MTALQTGRYLEDRCGLPCVICGSENVGQEPVCFRCTAPLELSRSVASRGTCGRFVSVLGASGAGKTVYLGMLLDILSKGACGLHGLPNGAFSLSVQQHTIAALQARRFPEKTPSEADHWKWVHCELSLDKKPKAFWDIITPDLAGEAIALEVEQPGTFPTIQAVVRRSEALIILVDSLRARDAGRDEDIFTMKMFSYVSSLHGAANTQRRRKLALPVAFVFTKCDICPEALENPAAFASANMPGLLRLCERNLEHFQFFAAGVVGSSASMIDEYGRHMLIPLHIQPRGVVEPVQWIVTRL